MAAAAIVVALRHQRASQEKDSAAHRAEQALTRAYESSPLLLINVEISFVFVEVRLRGRDLRVRLTVAKQRKLITGAARATDRPQGRGFLASCRALLGRRSRYSSAIEARPLVDESWASP
ncbi:unnamed protein product, partial [Polarella glacialis]